MPHELRKIYFNAVDLTHAVEAFRTEKPQFLPQGKLNHIAIGRDHVLVRIEMNYVDNTHVLDYKIDFDKLLEALVAFCIARRIPLPAAGSKRIYADGDEVVLEIVLADEAVFGVARTSEWTRLRGVG